jgi:hypothetical protein
MQIVFPSGEPKISLTLGENSLLAFDQKQLKDSSSNEAKFVAAAANIRTGVVSPVDRSSGVVSLEFLKAAGALLSNPVEAKKMADENGFLMALLPYHTQDEGVAQIDTVFGDIKGHLNELLGGEAMGHDRADIFLRAINALKPNVSADAIVEMYASLGGPPLGCMISGELEKIIEMGRDACAVADATGSSDNTVQEAMARLVSEEQGKPVVLAREGGGGQCAVKIFKGYGQEVETRENVSADGLADAIPSNAIAIKVPELKAAGMESELPSTTPSTAGTKPTCRAIEGKSRGEVRVVKLNGYNESMKAAFNPTCPEIRNGEWDRNKANGNCAIFALHDALEKADGGNGNPAGDLRRQMYAKIREEFDANCGQFAPCVDENLLLNIAFRFAQDRELLSSSRGGFVDEDLRAICAEYNRIAETNLTLDGKGQPPSNLPFANLIRKAFKVVTISTDKAWIDVEDLKYAARVLHRAIVVLDTQNDGSKIACYRVICANGDELFYKAEEDGKMGDLDADKTVAHPDDETLEYANIRARAYKVPRNALIIAKFKNHFIGPTELENPDTIHKLVTQNGQRLGIEEGHKLKDLIPEKHRAEEDEGEEVELAGGFDDLFG